MKYYIICGEASGDLHASELVSDLKKLDSDAQFRGFGGDLLAKQGMEIVEHISNHSLVGLSEIISKLPSIYKSLKHCKQDIRNWKPDYVIHIDYPGFNMIMGKFVSRLKIKNFYYIPPQMWAWRKSRIKKVKRYFSKSLVILPFEKDFYKNEGLNVEYSPNPLLKKIAEHNFDQIKSDKPIVALLPGSREKEVKRLLPLLKQLPNQFPNYSFIIAASTSIKSDFFTQILGENFSKFEIRTSETYNILKSAKAAIVASGTASLEAALIGTPQLVYYKTSRITYLLARMLSLVKYISLVNLIRNKKVVVELIQDKASSENIYKELNSLFTEARRKEIFEEYNILNKQMNSNQGQSAAQLIWDYIK